MIEHISTADILDLTRALIQNPDNWCQKYFAARNTDDPEDPIYPCDYPDADRFCLDGAITYARILLGVGGNGEYMEAYTLVNDAAKDLIPSFNIISQPHFNYYRTMVNEEYGHRTVMMVLDIACARARRVEAKQFVHEQEVAIRFYTIEKAEAILPLSHEDPDDERHTEGEAHGNAAEQH